MSSAATFVEAELRGVEGVRLQEMLGRWLQAGGEDKALTEAVSGEWIRKREPDGFYVFWPRWSDLSPARALLRLIGYPDWARFFMQLCEAGPERMAAQAWQFRDELHERGTAPNLAAVTDALFDLARATLPESPAASTEAFGDWAVELWRFAIRYVAKCWGEREGWPDLTDEGMEHLWGYRAAYRWEVRQRVGAVLRSWEKVVRPAIENRQKPDAGRDFGETGVA